MGNKFARILVALILISPIFAMGCANSPFGSSAADSDLGAGSNLGLNETPWLDNFAQAQQEAQQSGRVIMANFTGSDWCHWCVKLDEEVFEKSMFQQWAADNAVMLKVDSPRHSRLPSATKEQNDRLKSRYADHIRGYPTILFLSETGDVIGSLGYVKGGPAGFIPAAEKVLNGN